MEKPSSIATRRVAVQYVIGAVDGPDADDEPDFIPARGVVEFTASVLYTPYPVVSGPNPMTVLNAKITGVLDSEGYLCTPDPANPTLPGKRGVRLVCTDNVDGSVANWTWTAAPKFVDANGTRIPDVIPPFSFYLPSDPDPNAPDLDLTTVVKVPASQGTGTAQAEALAALASAAAASSADSAERAVAAAEAALGAAGATDDNVSALVEESGSATRMAVASVVDAKVAGEGFVSVDDNYDFPAPIAARQAEKLGEQVDAPGSPLRQTLDASYGRSATYNYTDAVTANSVRPDFVRTGKTLFTAADTGQGSIYWLYVLETPAFMNAPGNFMWFTTTDHDNGMGGIALGYSARPDEGPTAWSKITVQGLPAGFFSVETATPWVDLANNRLLVYFQVADENTGGSQDTHVMSTTDGVTFTYIRKLPDIPTLWPGDGHGGYLGPLMPFGNGYGAFTLSGGTDLARSRFLATRDGINWQAVGPPESTLLPSYDHPEPVGMPKMHMRPFMWRGQKWAVNRVATLNSAGAEPTYAQPMVFRLSDDNRSIVSDLYPTMTNLLPGEDSTDSVVNSVLYYKGQLYAYYRHGGKTGSYRLAISEA